MRICESSVVWWSTRELKADILLIHQQDRKKSQRKSWIHNIHLSLSVKLIEEYLIHKRKLFTDLCNNDEEHQNIFQWLLFGRNYRMKHINSCCNNTELDLELQELLWLFWYNCKRNLIQPNCWLRMTSWLVFAKHKNKAYCSLMRRSEFNHSQQ